MSKECVLQPARDMYVLAIQRRVGKFSNSLKEDVSQILFYLKLFYIKMYRRLCATSFLKDFGAGNMSKECVLQPARDMYVLANERRVGTFRIL